MIHLVKNDSPGSQMPRCRRPRVNGGSNNDSLKDIGLHDLPYLPQPTREYPSLPENMSIVTKSILAGRPACITYQRLSPKDRLSRKLLTFNQFFAIPYQTGLSSFLTKSRQSGLPACDCPEQKKISTRRYVRLKRTNLRVIELSLNRSQKRSALLSTTLRLRTRSSTNDLAPLRRMWQLSLRHAGAFVGARQEPSCCGFATAGAEIGRPAYIVASRRKRRQRYRHISGRDSDLEAFSHNPSDGSLAPLAYQPST